MSYDLPPPPFREREDFEKTPLAEEIKAVIGMYKLVDRLRAKDPDDPTDVDKEWSDTNESVII